MLERIRNLVKLDRKKNPSPDHQQNAAKRNKSSPKDKLQRRYPVTTGSDAVDFETLEQHEKAIEEEMKKSKPRDKVILPLMKSTFQSRWLYVQRDASSAKDILEKYPCYKFPVIVSALATYLYVLVNPMTYRIR